MVSEILGRIPYHFMAHSLMVQWIWQLPDPEAFDLARGWAESFQPGLGLDVCEELIADIFADHPDRYVLFQGLANLDF
jgi:hypothetical protein